MQHGVFISRWYGLLREVVITLYGTGELCGLSVGLTAPKQDSRFERILLGIHLD